MRLQKSSAAMEAAVPGLLATKTHVANAAETVACRAAINAGSMPAYKDMLDGAR